MRLCTVIKIAIVLATMLLAEQSFAEEILYGRYPALSPDGQTIAFTYRGDIWTVRSAGGEATRLTVHEAEDILPHFSPDGKWLMFSSRRFDNYDIFVMPAGGGEARQITVNTADDFGSGWFPGSDSVVFYSERDGRSDIYKAAIEGGTAIKITGDYFEREYDGKISADGRYMIFNNGSGISRWWRRDLRTAANSDIYLQDRSSRQFSSIRLTDHPTHEMWPIMNQARNEVYFVANYDNSWSQVYKVPMNGGEATAMTSFQDDGAQWLNSTPDGSMLVFEQGFRIWTLDPTTGKASQAPITISTDERRNVATRQALDNPIQWYSVAPDDKKIAVVMHGEVFVIPAEDAVEARRISSTAAREHHVVWGADSKTLYYCSDRDGDYAIYSADATTGVEKRLTKSNEAEMKPQVSPDGKYLVFFRGLDKIVRYEIATGKDQVWIKGGFHDYALEETAEFDWSGDSKWLTFTMVGPTYESDIWVASLDGKSENISKFAGYNFRPQFSADGKMIYFTGTLYDQTETFKIDLQETPLEFFESSLDSLFMGKIDKDSLKTKGEKKKADVEIDFSAIEKRRKRAFRLAGDNTWPALTPDGEKFFFVASLLGKEEIWSVVAEDESELKQVTSSGKPKSKLEVSADGKKLYYLEDGKLKSLTIADGKAETISFKAVADIDVVENYREKFFESWRMLKNYFYDPTFRGTNWEATRDKYVQVLPAIRTDEEFRNLMLELMGELRGSHLDYVLVESKPAETIVTAQTGIDLDFQAIESGGGFRIKYVLPLSPAAMVGIRAGQYLTAINKTTLSQTGDFETLLAGQVGKRLVLSISDSQNGATRDYEVKPITQAQVSGLRYENWVAQRRKMVDSLSNGRVAYLHIRAMNQSSLDLFKEQLVSIAESKDAMIIDVRENGGGSTAVHILGMLDRVPWLLRSFRNFPKVSENKYRSKAFERPLACLINGYSGSNAEIFAEGFRRHELGPIVGTPTGGAVIGTAEYYLVDGSRIRRPSWGAYTLEMEDIDLAPRRPDVFVENLPDDLQAGVDAQLRQAVIELMKRLK
ncbi:MAG: S41 family peptidase [Candidatus Zixiibacteriota bacterium]